MADRENGQALAQQGEAAGKQGTDFLTAGAAVGAMGVAGALLGAVCPLCVVVTPALVGAGLVQKWRARRLKLKAAAAGPVSATLATTAEVAAEPPPG